MVALGWTPAELAERSLVSKSILREIRDHSIERQRSRHTLSAISLALGWGEDYLTIVLLGQPPPPAPQIPINDRATLARLNAIKTQLHTLNCHLETIVEH